MGMYEIKAQKLDTLTDDLNKNIKIIIQNKKQEVDNLKNNYTLKNPEIMLDKYKHSLALFINTLKALNPLGTLEKGYSVIKYNNEIINSSDKLKIDEMINIKLFKGEVNALVKEIKK